MPHTTTEPPAGPGREHRESHQFHSSPISPPDDTPTCYTCHSSDFLVFESATASIDAGAEHPTRWDVTYWCGKCGSFYGHATRIPPTQPWLIASAYEAPVYTHCGRPMQQGPAEGTAPTDIEVGQILRCDCGFHYLSPLLPPEG